MATQENAALPRRDARSGGALDAETQQQVADLNLQGFDVVRGALAAAGVVAAGGGPAADSGAVGRRPARRGGAASGRAQAGPAGRGAVGAAGARAGRVAPARARSGGGVAWPARGASPALPEAIHWLGAEWLALDDAARLRLSACPYLLFELDLVGLLEAATVPPRFVQEARGAPDAPGSPTSPFTSAEGRNFARLLLLYAWHLVRTAPSAAPFVLGAPQRALEPLRTLSLARVEGVGALAAGWVRLRWDHEPLIWMDWLESVRRAEPAAIWSSQARGLQRIAGACRDTPQSL